MTGWFFTVHRQLEGGSMPARARCSKGLALASWQAYGSGLDWMHNLVKQGFATALGGNGYPFWYTAQAHQLIPFLSDGPPRVRKVSNPKIDLSVLVQCPSDEWLIIEVWDED
jgi:hypothetical protein